MKIIHCKNHKFLTYEALLRFMIRNNYRSVKIKVEDHGTTGREIIATLEYVKGILLKEKYNVDEIIRTELEKYGTM